MKFLLRHILLLGVILGLAGQGVAFASTPCAMMQAEQASSMSGPMAGMPDCAMGQHTSDKGSTPCKNMTAGCLAMAGCTALVAVDSLTPIMQAPLLLANLDLWPATSVVRGREVAPELDPPSFLG
jgi:hypothetical protein